jgi:small subunit ribosomal protein S5
MRQENNDERDSEFQDKVVAIKRVVKVVKGGRNMRFSALVVVGDGKGRVGVGLGKAAEIPEAIRKGREAAQKSMVTVVMDENASAPHDYIGHFGGSTVLLKRAPEGTGIIAGGPVRVVCELAGIRNIRTKSLGSNNKQNVVLATLDAFEHLKSPEEVARLRGKTVDEIRA